MRTILVRLENYINSEVSIAYKRGYEDGKKAEWDDGMLAKINDLIRMSDQNSAYTFSYPAYSFISKLKKIVGYEGYEERQKGFEKCSECKYKDADLCKTTPLHEEDEEGNCVDFVPEIVKPRWVMIPKCTTCKYFNSPIVPCNRCKDNSEYVPKNAEDMRKESE